MTELEHFFALHTLKLGFSMHHEVSKLPCPFHNHPAIELVFHARGEGVTHIRGHQPIRFGRHSTVIYPPLAMHDQIIVSKGVDICLHLSTTAPLPTVLAKPLHIRAQDDPFIAREFQELAQEWHGAAGLGCRALDHRATGLLAHLLQAVHVDQDAATPADICARRAMEYIRSSFGKHASLGEIADRVGLSYHYLRHIFKDRFGISMKQALIRARLEYARELLAHSPLPQKAIAVQCGFQTERYFSSVFHSMIGMTAGEYRGQHSTRQTHPRPDKMALV